MTCCPILVCKAACSSTSRNAPSTSAPASTSTRGWWVRTAAPIAAWFPANARVLAQGRARARLSLHDRRDDLRGYGASSKPLGGRPCCVLEACDGAGSGPADAAARVPAVRVAGHDRGAGSLTVLRWIILKRWSGWPCSTLRLLRRCTRARTAPSPRPTTTGSS